MAVAMAIVFNAAWPKVAQPILPRVVLVGGAPSGRQRGFGSWRMRMWREAPGAAPTSIDVHTPSGVTRAYRWAGDGTPIVFLHGGGMTSVSWAPYAETLSCRDVYAVDIMGDAGRSEPIVWISCAADFARWLDETLAGLGVERAHSSDTHSPVSWRSAPLRTGPTGCRRWCCSTRPASLADQHAPLHGVGVSFFSRSAKLGARSMLAWTTTAKPHAGKQARLVCAVARHGPSRTRLSTFETPERRRTPEGLGARRNAHRGRERTLRSKRARRPSRSTPPTGQHRATPRRRTRSHREPLRDLSAAPIALTHRLDRDRHHSSFGAGYSDFCQTEMWLRLSLVKGSRFQSLHRSRKAIPARRAMRSNSDGHTLRNGAEKVLVSPSTKK